MINTIQTLRSRRLLLAVACFVVVWFAIAEVANETWYAIHESKLKPNPLPAEGSEIVKRLRDRAEQEDAGQIDERDIGAVATDMLKCSFGKTLTWTDSQGLAAVTVLRWVNRSVPGGVENQHNPGVCLSAAGWTIGQRTDLGFKEFYGITANVTEWQVRRPGIQMLAYSAVFHRFAGAPEIENKTGRNDLRWGAVWAGRRDAPVLVLLVYLSGDPSESTEKREEFGDIMRTALGDHKETL